MQCSPRYYQDRHWSAPPGRQATGIPAYRDAVRHVLGNLPRYRGYDWESGSFDGYADTIESARLLLETIDRPNLGIYWQPPPGSTVTHNLAGIGAVYRWLTNLHVFTWDAQTHERLPLAAGESDWSAYLDKAAGNDQDRFALIEFVQDDTDEAFLQDAATLLRWLDHVNAQHSTKQQEIPPGDRYIP